MNTCLSDKSNNENTISGGLNKLQVFQNSVVQIEWRCNRHASTDLLLKLRNSVK